MKTMIVCIDYNTDGTRYISSLYYTSFVDGIHLSDVCREFKTEHDEVYTIELDPSHKEFIEYIVLHGCRM